MANAFVTSAEAEHMHVNGGAKISIIYNEKSYKKGLLKHKAAKIDSAYDIQGIHSLVCHNQAPSETVILPFYLYLAIIQTNVKRFLINYDFKPYILEANDTDGLPLLAMLHETGVTKKALSALRRILT